MSQTSAWDWTPVSLVYTVQLKDFKKRMLMTPKCFCLAISWEKACEGRSYNENVHPWCNGVSISANNDLVAFVTSSRVYQGLDGHLGVFRWKGQCLCQWAWSLGSHCLPSPREWRTSHRWEWAANLENKTNILTGGSLSFRILKIELHCGKCRKLQRT